MAYLTEAKAAVYFGTDELSALIDATSTTYDDLEATASSTVDAVLQNAGYTVPLTGTTPGVVELAVVGVLGRLLYQRKGLNFEDNATVISGLTILELIRTGELQVSELTASDRDAVGGVSWTDSSATSTDGKPRVFDDLRKIY